VIKRSKSESITFVHITKPSFGFVILSAAKNLSERPFTSFRVILLACPSPAACIRAHGTLKKWSPSMEYLAILIAWWLLSPFLRFFADHPLLSFLLVSTGVFLYRRRRRAQDRLTAVSSSLSQSPLSRESSSTNTAEHTLIDLLILRNEITHRLKVRAVTRFVTRRYVRSIRYTVSPSIAFTSHQTVNVGARGETRRGSC
jgi:hypothetical protein